MNLLRLGSYANLSSRVLALSQPLFHLGEESFYIGGEAGYTNGFNAKMVVQNISVEMDSAAIFKAMWSKVGVDLEIQPRESAVYRSINTASSQATVKAT
ncbi:MAG: hypothetical protein HYX85_03035 [Chloroflexi bacterium]|nr:hypothetical protein [Chloroflexota bacterium]